MKQLTILGALALLSAACSGGGKTKIISPEPANDCMGTVCWGADETSSFYDPSPDVALHVSTECTWLCASINGDPPAFVKQTFIVDASGCWIPQPLETHACQ